MPVDYSNVLYEVYNGYDNVIEVTLKAKGEAEDISQLTRAQVIEENHEFTVDSDEDSDAFDWLSPETGLLKIQLGHQDVPAGVYRCWLIVHDEDHEAGIVWSRITLKFIDI